MPRGGIALPRCRLVEESKLGCIGGFELKSPVLKIFVLDRRGARPRELVANLKPPQKLIDRHFQEHLATRPGKDRAPSWFGSETGVSDATISAWSYAA
jgi:hypothetical protein